MNSEFTARPTRPNRTDTSARASSGVSNTRETLMACMELLFFAYRDFIGDPDSMLERYGFGRAHHRVLHFVGRNPGLRVADLLVILRITKQSLAPVLKQLVDEGYVTQEAGQSDRRERHLYVTQKGMKLTDQLADLQMARIKEALESAGPDSEETLRRFLFAMIAEDERSNVARLIDGATNTGNQLTGSTT
ncbi:MAG: MarR family transcriptional regulator [Alphaproteobacteria bacterium]|nr:MarR family transcriptional regulator [Alphaproteobacteria bacterium]